MQNHIFVRIRFGEICLGWEDLFGVLHVLLEIPAAAFTPSKPYLSSEPCCAAERLHRETAVDIGVEKQIT